ncbi:MAG: adenylyl-sulfate kinase [Acidobacteriia bacterium]|nr:adenylyl-sulfate kinase [Terriglobia bacterium]
MKDLTVLPSPDAAIVDLADWVEQSAILSADGNTSREDLVRAVCRAYSTVESRVQIPRFMEVYVDCPLATCIARDPKGIYRKAREGEAETVPGLQAAYEPPEKPELVVDGGREMPETAARRVMIKLTGKGYLYDD